jgi:eukaryotic-like serine/threonine-protein kinase
MPLSVGTRVGSPEVLASIGAGGMGEVYKARDTRLGRLVALKVLPSELTADRDARERLEREARTLASISHPHVCPLFELVEHEDQLVLVMEYLEGTTLAERLRNGPLQVSECLRIGADVGDGLAAAHRGGIVHRDLKPENIMLTKSGARLLDFGLARPRIAAVSGDMTEAVTHHQLTRVGTIAGTLPYMAPEQLEGREVDARTDIWALGCVLYEMVTGRRPFQGTTSASVIGMILERDPPPPSSVQPMAGGALERVIQKCLARDPDARWQTAQDLRDELTWIGGGDAALPRQARSDGTSWRYGLAGAVLGAALAAAGLVASPGWTSVQPVASVSRLQLTIPRLAHLESLTVSPDGRRIAFIAADAQGQNLVWVRDLSENAPRPLAGTEGAFAGSPPFWSPDGQSLAFVAGRRLKRIRVAAGGVVTLADVPGAVMGGSWGRDGTILVGTQHMSRTHGVHRTSDAGGPLLPLVPLEPRAFLHGSPKFLPDDRRFLYLSWAFDEERRQICMASLDEPTGRCFPMKVHFLAGFTPDGHLVYARGDTLFAQPVDFTNVRATGEPVVIAERLSRDPFGRTSVSMAGATTLVYQTAPAEVRQFVWVDRTGRRGGLVGEPGAYGGFDLTARGEFVLAERADVSGTNLWLIDATRGGTTRAVASAVAHERLLGPVFAGDGRRFFYRTHRAGRTAIVEQPTRGGEDRVVFEYPAEGIVYLADVSEDGQYLAVGIVEPGRMYAVVVPRTGGDPVTIAEGPIDAASVRFSPDGRWAAHVSQESGQPQVFVSPLPPTGERWPVSTTGGVQPAWRGDGRELYYLAPDGSLMAVPIAMGPTFEAGVPVPLFGTRELVGLFRIPGYRPTADGQRFLLNAVREGDQAATTTTLEVVLNWAAGVTR